MAEKSEFFDLDMHRLDEEWLRQPRLYHDYAVKLADARATWERAKAAREVVQAELDRDARRSPSLFGLDKVTEPAVEKAVLLHKRYQKANEEVIIAKHEMDVLQAAVDTLEHKKKALENMVSLHGRDYFAVPRATAETGPAVERMKSDRALGPRRRA